MKPSIIATATLAALTLTLAACDRPTVVAVPAPGPAVVVPGPAGPPGAPGNSGATGAPGTPGEPGKPGDSSTTVIVTPKQ